MWSSLVHLRRLATLQWDFPDLRQTFRRRELVFTNRLINGVIRRKRDALARAAACVPYINQSSPTEVS
jgi:hypothetical protein